MKLRNLRIGTQLSIGLSTSILLVVALAYVAMDQADQLWETTVSMYRHPLHVRRSLGKIESDVLLIRNGMKVFLLEDSEEDREKILRQIAESDADIERQFVIVYERYLGESVDIDTTYNTIQVWRSIRAETIRLYYAGQHAVAIERTLPDGIDGLQAKTIFARMNVLIKFADAKADSFYAQADSLRQTLLQRFVLAVTVILLISVLTGLLLFRNIRSPLKEMTEAANLFSSGNLGTRISFHSKNELGLLSDSLNLLAETVEEEIATRKSVQTISDSIINVHTIQEFSTQLLTQLEKHTEALFSALYIADDASNRFVLSGALGLSGDIPSAFSKDTREGVFALALETQQVQRIENIPASTVFLHSTVAGKFVPKEMIIIPIVFGDVVLSMLALGSVHPFSDRSIRVLSEISDFTAAKVSGVIASRKLTQYSEKLETQNQELAAQSEELSVQANELSMQANELSMQTEEFAFQNKELLQQKQKLDEANRLKSTFLSNMSHELRTPLNSVIALSSVLRKRLDGSIPEEEHDYLEIIERNGRHLLNLINDVLDLSRIESGQEDVVFSLTRVHLICNEVVDMISPQAEEKGITLTSSVSDNLPSFTTDTGKYRQILINLVGNAVKFTDSGYVRLSAEIKDQHILLSVEDTGIGIAAEQLDAIYEEFRQVDASASRKYGGSGLGLAIAMKYAVLLGGTIRTESEPGKGSRFILDLPLNRTEVSPEPEELPSALSAQQKLSREAPSTRGRTILLVEDSEPALIQLRDMLRAEGYQIVMARDGLEALDKIEEVVPDIMILDLMMPGIDGFEVLRIIRSQPRSCTLPVVILTAKHITKEELAFLKGNNVRQLIQKGDVSKKELLFAVSSMIDTAVPSPGEVRRKVFGPDQKPRIVIVEDNADNRVTLVAMLAGKYELYQAGNGPDGIEMARRQKPDLILLDISLPGIDGFTVFDMIRGDPALSGIPIIAVTARAMQSDMDRILSHGFDAYVSKPIDAAVLDQKIRGLLNGHG